MKQPTSQERPNNKNYKCTFFINDRKVVFSGDFDTGNLKGVQQFQGNPKEYKLWAGLDSQDQQCSVKTFFHFQVTGFLSTKVRFRIMNMNILSPLLKVILQLLRQSERISSYRPVYRTNNMEEYDRIPSKVISNNYPQRLEIAFDFTFGNQQYVYFAFSYPYSYQRSNNFVQKLYKELQNNNEVYFHKEVLILSNQERPVEMVTVTHPDNCLSKRGEVVEGLFPFAYSPRALKIKPIVKVMITARVHPGESTSSYCFQGLLKFLTNKHDYRAHLLRKKFHFVLIPMLNPDGVYNGMYRWDPSTNQDLNRVYKRCTQKSEPTIWAIKCCIQKILKGIDFYFDLHGHASSIKNFFVYGNAFDNIVSQTESEVFAKVLSINCPYFSIDDCNFNKEDRESRKGQESKEGCARYYLMKTYKIIHSFTVECGFHSPEVFNPVLDCSNPGIIYQGTYQLTQDPQKERPEYYSTRSFQDFGKAILVSLLDVTGSNPYSRIPNTEQKTMEEIRKQKSNYLYRNEDRIRIADPLLLKRLKNINQLCAQYYKTIFYRFKEARYSAPKYKTVLPTQVNRDQQIARTEVELYSPVTSLSLPKQLKVPNFQSQSMHNINRIQLQSVSRKQPNVTEIVSSYEYIRMSHSRNPSRMPNKTLETDRLNYRTKKANQSKSRRQVRQTKLLPIKESEYILAVIRQKLQGINTSHRQYIPSSLPPIRQKSTKQSIKLVKMPKHSSPSPF